MGAPGVALAVFNFDYSLLYPTVTPFTPRAGKTAPSPPWDVRAVVPPQSELVRKALASRSLIDALGQERRLGERSGDYAELFALYNGLSSLEALAKRADEKGVSSVEMTRLERRFQTGIKEVGGYVDTLKLDELKLVRGDVGEQARAAAGVKRATAEYRTRAVHAGERDAPVAAWSGDVKFQLTVSTPPHRINTVDADGRPVVKTIPSSLPPKTVAFDLAELGPPEARTMGAVVNYLNGKLSDAGLLTRFSREQLPQAPRTVKVGERTVTLPAGPDQWGLKLAGVSTEVLDFSAPDSADAVYVSQLAGEAVRDKPGSQTGQLLKFQTDTAVGAPPPALQTVGEANWVEGRVFVRPVDLDIAAVRASAAGADGSVYTLAEVTGDVMGQDIKGARDVALLKYDSTGRLLWSRNLGAADAANAAALTVAPDGKVAIGGSVTGALRDAGATTPLNTAQTDSFVTVFDTEGSELWTRRGGAVGADEVKALAFGADGAVYAAGQVMGSMPGGVGAGDQDGWIRGWDATGRELFTRQFGALGADSATALAVEGGVLVAAGVENGRAVLRRFDLNAAGGPAETAVRDLGALEGGSIKALALEGGRLTVAGATRAGGLAGVANNTFSGGRDGFVAALDGSLAAAGTDRVSYWGGAGEEDIAAVTIRGGQVWMTGAATGEIPGTTKLGDRDGFVTRIDAETGAVGWSRRWTAKDGEAIPTAIAVGTGGASVLDRLGLPTGAIDYTGAQEVAASSPARAGDRFYLKVNGGRQVAVTLEPGDTLKSLADRINRVAGFNVRAEVGRSAGLQGSDGVNYGGLFDRLVIKPRNDRATIELMPGEAGRDLLGALGLMDGVVRRTLRDGDGKEIIPEGGKTYGLKLARDLNFDSKVEIKRAMDEISTAMNSIRMAYRALADADKPKDERPAITGTAPAWMQRQAANYQAALSRLTGGG